MFPLGLSGSEENIVTDSRQVRLATGLFPVVSLLNHSCSPNTSVSFVGTVATVRASQQIGEGQEILHCYGEPSLLAPVTLSRRKGVSKPLGTCLRPASDRFLEETVRT